ncbi:MAG: hypothetical protein FWH36_07770 [Lentimicrobiaceae bacterium]|nr:hypothetical protein [Lentimicrobiaceae bacterium]
MKKILISVIALAITGVAAVAFHGCKKEDVLDTTKTKELKTVGYLRADYFCYGGQIYKLDSDEAWEFFDYYGGHFWFVDDDGTKWEFWPNGSPYWKHGNGQGSGVTPPSSPPPYLSSIGKFVHNTLFDIMNAPLDERQALVVENMDGTYHPLVSLNAKIGEALLAKVVSGEYVISNITETVTETTDGNEIVFEYLILFSYPGYTDIAEEATVSFIYEYSEEDD